MIREEGYRGCASRVRKAAGEREAHTVRSQARRHDSERYAGMLTSKLAGMKVPEAGTERYGMSILYQQMRLLMPNMHFFATCSSG